VGPRPQHAHAAHVRVAPVLVVGEDGDLWREGGSSGGGLWGWRGASGWHGPPRRPGQQRRRSRGLATSTRHTPEAPRLPRLLGRVWPGQARARRARPQSVARTCRQKALRGTTCWPGPRCHRSVLIQPEGSFISRVAMSCWEEGSGGIGIGGALAGGMARAGAWAGRTCGGLGSCSTIEPDAPLWRPRCAVLWRDGSSEAMEERADRRFNTPRGQPLACGAGTAAASGRHPSAPARPPARPARQRRAP
jgi:hypothetical protein